MTFKKISSIVLAVAMLVSMFAVTSFAAGETMEITYENITTGKAASDKIELNDIFYAVIKLKGVTTTLGGGSFALTYDTGVVQLAKTDGTLPLNFGTSSYSPITSTITVNDTEISGYEGNAFDVSGATVNTTDGIVDYAFSSKIFDGASYYPYVLTADDKTNGLTYVKMRFKAVGEGNANFAFDGLKTKFRNEFLGESIYPTAAITPLTIGGGALDTFTVTFNSANGSPDTTVDVTDGEKVAEPMAPTKDGYTFDGWFTAAEGGTAFDFETAITANITLYAQWTAVPQDQDAPLASLFTATAPTTDGGADGIISGTTTDMEYKLSADVDYTACAGTSITGLVAGTYDIRYKAKTGFNASPATQVTVPAYTAPGTDPVVKIGSDITDVHAGTVVAVNVTVSNFPAEAGGVQFTLAYDNTLFENVSIASNNDAETGVMGETDIGSIVTVDTTDSITFAGFKQDDATFEGNDVVIATVTLKVKAGIEIANATLTLSDTRYGTGASTGSVVTESENGTIAITKATYQPLVDAETAVAEYEGASLDNLTEVADAEDLGDEADSAVAAIDDVAYPEYADEKDALEARIAAMDKIVAAYRAVLEYETAEIDTLVKVDAARLLQAPATTAVNDLPDGAIRNALSARITARAGAIDVQEKYLEAVEAVTTYVNAPVTTFEEITTAEGYGDLAVAAVAAIDDETYPDYASGKATLSGDIGEKDVAVAAAKETLSIADINGNKLTKGLLKNLGLTDDDLDKKPEAAYKLAVSVTRRALDNAALNKTQILQAVTEANAVADIDMGTGFVDDDPDPDMPEIDINDALMVQNHVVNASGTEKLTVARALKADMDKDGVLAAFDVTAILAKIVE